MKNLIAKSAFLLFAFTICSFQAPKPTLQEIFQTALNIEQLEDYLAKNNDGEMLPLTLISNDYISSNIDLNFGGHKVLIETVLNDQNAQNESILELTEIKMKGKKSILAFKYGEKTIKVRLKKDQNSWVAKALSVKWKNGFNTILVSTEEKHF